MNEDHSAPPPGDDPAATPLVAATLAVELAWSLARLPVHHRRAGLEAAAAQATGEAATAIVWLRRNGRGRWGRSTDPPLLVGTLGSSPGAGGGRAGARLEAAGQVTPDVAGLARTAAARLAEGEVGDRHIVTGSGVTAIARLDDVAAAAWVAATDGWQAATLAALAVRAVASPSDSAATGDPAGAESASAGTRPQLRLAHQRVLDLLLRGLSEPAVADELNLSVATVHGRVRRIYRHYGVDSRPKLLAKLLRPPGDA